MVLRLPRPKHPFPFLLSLELILLGIALIAVLTPTPGPRRSRSPAPADVRGSQVIPADGVTAPTLNQQPPCNCRRGRRQRFPRYPAAAAISIGALGILGLRFSMVTRPLAQALFTLVGLELSWLAVLFGGNGQSVLPPLLLVVVIRACLMFPGRGQIAVALVAFGSFILMLGLAANQVMPFGVPLTRFFHRRWFRANPDLASDVVLNASLLFGLVLSFVILLVVAFLATKKKQRELTQANDRLRRYALLIENQAALQERQRIAREMHDSVGHCLTAQSIQLENVTVWLDKNSPKAADHLAKARQLNRDALQNVRQSVSRLRQDPLQGKPLSQALQHLLTEFERTNGIEVIAELDRLDQWGKDVTIAVYRIIQEALTNISKHAQATRVTLEWSEGESDADLKITDNGRGFDPTQHQVGFGLQSMRERTEAMGGDFSLISQPEQGCQIRVRLPLQQET